MNIVEKANTQGIQGTQAPIRSRVIGKRFRVLKPSVNADRSSSGAASTNKCKSETYDNQFNFVGVAG